MSPTSMSTAIEYTQLLEIDAGEEVHTLAFSANGDHLISGGRKGVGVWRVKDGKQVAAMPVGGGVDCVATSGDGRRIAAGSNDEVFVWDAMTYEQVFTDEIEFGQDIELSPDSTQLVTLDGFHNTATIRDISAGKQVLTLRHNQWNQESLLTAKYSPRGGRIATATKGSVCIWDSNTGRFIVSIKAGVEARRGLFWCNNHLFVKTNDATIKQIDATTGSTVSDWLVPHVGSCSIALPQHGKFIACSAEKTITFWDTVVHAQFSPIQHAHKIHSIACSSDGQFLAFAAERKVIVKDLSYVVFPPIPEPELGIDIVALSAWKHGQLKDAEELLSAAISTSNKAHLLLACRAFVWARLGRWDKALVDAKESIDVERSLIGYVAKCVALVGNGEKQKGLWMCDIMFLPFPSTPVPLLLLIKVVVLFMAGEHTDAMSCTDELITDAWSHPVLFVVQAHMHLLLGNKHMESSNYKRAIQSFEDAQVKLRNRTRQPPLILSLISGWRFDNLAITIQQRLCEALLAADHTKEAGESMLRMLDQENNITEPIESWVSDYKRRFYTKLEDLGDRALDAQKYDEAVSHYTVALSLNPDTPQDLLVKRSNARWCKGARKEALDDAKEWVKLALKSSSWRDALAVAVSIIPERFPIYQAVCEHLEMIDRVADAVACFHQLSGELAQDIEGDQAYWTLNFKSRCRGKLEDLGDSAAIAKQYDEAIKQYSTALSLGPSRPQDLLVKRSKAYAEKGKWEDALSDADEIIRLDSSSPLGYERKYAALLGAGYYDEAVDAFDTILLKISESPDPGIRERSHLYEQTRRAIRTSVKKTILHCPLVLINTSSGRLCNKSEQAAAFELTPVFARLITSMTAHINHALISQAVGEFYRYATLSHTWEDNEPLYDKVVKIVVYELEALPTHEKLQMFCKVAQGEGFIWAWSDTCCINKGDHFVLQEALVSMFRWYAGSAMTIIFLFDVDQLAGPGALTRSRWNSRAWTFQEYHASRVVRIYTKDWTPYLGLTIHNYKESPQIISEMEQATSISAQTLMELRPGLNNIRQKLCLAATRQTTRVEDAAYSLLGIFSMTLPVTYGEGDKALGRFLSQLLMSSGDTSILAWNGRSGSFNSCLPASISVFSKPLALHFPRAIPDVEMDTVVAGRHASLLDHSLVTRLYDEVGKLPTPTFAGQRMRLPCLVFKIRSVSPPRNGVFRVHAGFLGAVDIKTKRDLTQPGSFYLAHPWIDSLLDRHSAGATEETVHDEDETSDIYESPSSDSFPDPSSTPHASPANALVSLPSPSTAPSIDAQTRAYEFLARLRQPFGALLLTPTRRNVTEYKRIVAENLITARVTEITAATLDGLIQSVQVLDVL